MSWYRLTPTGGAVLSLHIQPGAKTSACAGLHGDALKIRLAAPPVDGKANEALLRFLAETLALPRQQLRLKSGQSSRQKRIEIDTVTPEQLAALLSH